MDKLGESLASWLLKQIEFMPLEVLRDNVSSSAEAAIERFLGKREVAEVHALLARPSDNQPRAATVLLPGIMGSLLASIRGISTLLWFNPTLVFEGHLNLLDLNEDGTGDRSPDVDIVPVGIEKLTYLKLIVALAQHTRLYEFPYDWRRKLEYSAHQLRNAIARWSQATPDRRFVLVGHSMGGMLARTYMALYPQEAEQYIERVVMLGTPLSGAPLALTALTGQARHIQITSRLHRNNDAMQFAARLPSTYQLLPPPEELFSPARSYPTNWNIYHAESWQMDHIRQDYLDGGYALHRLLADHQPQVPIVEIAGCHRNTLTDIWKAQGEPLKADTSELFTLVSQESGTESGDDSVPLWSTRLAGITTHYVEESHNLLPGNTQIIDAILRLVWGQDAELPTEVPEPSGLWQRIASTSVREQVADLRTRLVNGELRKEDLFKFLMN